MGKHQELEEPNGSLPNGLLPGLGLVIRSLDAEHWLKAEERTAELIACIQPNQPSEKRRNAVADYVQHLIMKCFPCQVCTFGSVPLKTYLPDGDIDLTAFCHNQNLKDTWANQVLDMLQNEKQKENAEFHVKEVQYIQAEVKIIKCLVENIVVDISFNQIGGLCTLCFLIEIDNLIGQNHLFKRSIILIKAWCYYESRILGAHHGLISTYALETLVLYIFHVFNNSFLGPLEVLYRFLEFFSNFDWDNFCVSLWGPVPINSLPNMTAEPPRKDSGELLLSKLFLEACSSVYAVFPDGQENNGQQFVSKYFNVIDPLRVNNNLGRSVSKGNFFRIRSAFAFGAKRLARLHGCPKENVTYEVNQFFMNTWERHGSGHRPDAPGVDLWRLKISTPDSLHEFENFKKNINVKKVNDNSSVYETKGQQVRTFCISSPNANSSAGSMSRTSELSDASQNRSLKSQINSNSLRGSNRIGRNSASNQDVHNNKLQRDLKANHLVNAIQGRFLFARTHSSPELTDSHADVSAQIPHNRQIESARTHATSVKLDITNRTKNLGSESLTSHQNRSSVEDNLATRHAPTHRRLDASVDPKNTTNYFRQDWSDALDEELSSTNGTQGKHQEEQEVHLPLSLASSHLPFPIPISFLDPMDYTQPNVRGLVPTDIPSTNPSFSNVQLPHGSVAHQLTHYFPDNGLSSPSADSIERSNGNFGCVEMSSEEVENDSSSSGGHDPENENYEMLQTDNTQPAKMSGLKHVPPLLSGSGSYTRIQQKCTKEKRGSMEEESDSYLFQDSSSIDVFAEERSESSRFSSATHGNSVRSRTSLETSSDGSSIEGSKSTKEKRGKKLSSTDPATGHGKGKIMSENMSNQGEDGDKEWGPVSNVRTVNTESNPASQLVASLHVPRHHMPGFEVGQTNGSDSMFPIAPMLMGSGSRENMTDNSEVIEFYPTGPPVPFLTMLTVYNIPPQPDTADTSILHFDANGSLDNCDSDKHFSPERFHRSEDLNSSSSLRGTAAIETSDDQKSDILTSDFDSHWHNLLFGRFCQNPDNHVSLLYPSPVVVPPIYLQGHFPFDNPGSPLSANTNLFTQLMSSYGHHLIPATPLQSISSRPPNVYQRYTDGMPRHRNGTGTYLPNPTIRERHSSSTRRRNNNYDRNDNHGDREGNPNAHSKSRPMARSYNHNQTEKSYSKSDRVASSESRADRSWRHDKVPSYQSQSGPLRSNFSQNGPPNVAHNMYPLPAMNAVGVSSNAPSVPRVMMIYPFDHSATYGSSHGEQLEFGPVNPVGFPGMNEQSQINEGSRARTFEYHRFHGGSGPRSSPDQPSSPRYQR